MKTRKMNIASTLLTVLPLSGLALAETPKSASSVAKSEVLDACLVLDRATYQQGNTTLKIERLLTPDEAELKEVAEAARDGSSKVPIQSESVISKAFAVHALTIDKTASLITCWSLDPSGGQPTKFWSTITAWNELVASSEFKDGDVAYSMMVFPAFISSGLHDMNDVPEIPEDLTVLASEGARYQSVGDSTPPEGMLDFLESLHEFHDTKRASIKRSYRKTLMKIAAKEQKAKAEDSEGKVSTLRFWRRDSQAAEKN